MPMNPKVRVLLVDDHGVVRQGMKLYLAADSSIEVVGEANNGQEALTQVEKLEPNVVIMDLLMPVMDGISAIREIKKRFPEVEIVAVTSVLEDKKVVDAVQAGAMGYLLKDTDAAALSEAIHAASRGEVRLHPEAAKRLMREVRTPEMRESLTPRETEILKLLAQGHSNKHIARETKVEERTVKAHVSSILAKLGLSSRTQAALFALKEGLVG
ncbi:two component transcriptional regulator, LuxR family [Allomeiothermus silvanus DSM 9946]|uniref:Two component transcriptional regulator, LuxR family n=2 Tax=Allomeiothermus silvanus TaxID=52022 RepID=D7BCV7_ALLS1|nr:two component transcriptional regulator, LuxR family [Allomeiothermus silvanus DSM 9946]